MIALAMNAEWFKGIIDNCLVTEIGAGIVTAAIDLNVDMVFVGTGKPGGPSSFLLVNDPVAHHIVDHC